MINAFKAVRLTSNILSGTSTGLSYGGSGIVFHSQTGGFYPASNPSGFITAAQAGGLQSITVTGLAASGALTLAGGSGISLALSSSTNGTITINANTGSFVTQSQTGQFVWTGSQQSFVSSIPMNVDVTGILFPVAFGSIPKVQATVEVTGDIMYGVNIRSRSTTGYFAIFSDTISEAGVVLHTHANL